MKQISYWLLTVILLLIAFGCSKDAEMLGEVDPIEPPQEQTHRVPVEAALSELQAVLDGLDGGTRASGLARSVAWVSTVKAEDVIAETRTGDAADIEDLVYIANFENGEGYAILAADDRLESVIAITDQGSLTPEEFAAVANGEYDIENGEVPPVFPDVVNYARAGWNTNIGGGTIGGGTIGGGDTGGGGTGDTGDTGELPPFPHQTYTKYTSWSVSDRIGPFMPMRWAQDMPYNMYVYSGGRRCKIGCVAVAVAQIFASNRYRFQRNSNPIGQYDDMTVDWRVIFKLFDTYSQKDITKQGGRYLYPSDNSPEAQMVAKYLAGMSQDITKRFGEATSSSTSNKAEAYLESQGYRNVKKRVYGESLVRMMIVDRGFPIYVSGDRPQLFSSGHAWIIDGMLAQTRSKLTFVSGTDDLIDSTPYSRTLFHCNFGWGGTCDGYYYPYSFFNPMNGPVYTESGDIRQGADHNYPDWLRVITYTNIN